MITFKIGNISLIENMRRFHYLFKCSDDLIIHGTT